MKVKFISKNKDNSLTLGKEYVVVGIECDFYRIVSDNNEPVLFDPKLFEIVDADFDKSWILTYDEEGCLYANPPELDQPGFYEDYHNDEEYAIKRFQEYIDAIGLNIQAKPYHYGL